MIPFELLTTSASISAISIFIFLSIITLCFVKWGLIRNDINSRGAQKIIGGLSVFVVAILSQKDYIIITSLFIGGLIIASEEFMEKLVIILRSRSEDIGQNLKYSKASTSEIEEKQEAEAEALDVKKFKERLNERLKETQEALENAKERISTSQILSNIKNNEKLVTSYLIDKYGDSFHPQVKIVSKKADVNLVVDGLLTDKENNVTTIFEIKYLSSLGIARIILRRTVEHLRFYFKTQRIVLCVVSEKITKRQIRQIKEFMNNFDNVEILFFKIKQGKIVEQF